MLTDEELIQQVRRRLHAELAEIYPAETAVRALQHVVMPSGASRRPRHLSERFSRFGGVVALAVAVAVVAAVVVVAAGLGGRSQLSHQPSSRGTAKPEEPLLRILAVLRRPQTKSDLPPALLRVLRRPGYAASAFNGTPDLAGVRLAAVTPEGEQVFLVPVKPPTAASISAYLSGLRGRQARLRAEIARNLRAQAAQGDQLEVQVLYHGQNAGGSQLSTAHQIERYGTRTFGGRYLGNSIELTLVVPDGVSKVTLFVPSERTSTAPLRVTGTVHTNVLAVQLPPASNATQNMIWYGPAGNVVKRFGDTNPTTPPPLSSVRAPITVHVIRATRYCYKRLAFGGFEIPCDHGIPHGYEPAPWVSRSLALVDISFIARLAANNRHSVYEFSYGRSSGPASCTLNTGGTAGTTMVPIRAGQRVTIQDDAEVCPGTFGGIISYQPNGGPGQDTLNFGSPVRDGSVLVGTFSYVIRKR